MTPGGKTGVRCATPVADGCEEDHAMKYALHTVSYAGFWKGQEYLSLEDSIRKAAALGFDGVEIMAKRPHASVLDMTGDRPKALRELMGSEGIECACIAGYTDFLQGVDSMLVPLLEMQVAHVEQLAQMARALGGSLVRVFTGYEHKTMQYWPQWNICVGALKECAKRAAQHGVTIGIQNHHDIGADDTGMADLIDDIGEPNCKAMFDAWVPALMGVDLKAAVRRMAGKMVYTTAADYVRMPRFNYEPSLTNYTRSEDMLKAVPMGEGFIDYRGFFAALREQGYGGYVCYEMCSPLRGGGSIEVLDGYARKFLEFMKAV